jgi:hypothetical protein
MNLDLPEFTAAASQGALCQVKVSKPKPTGNAVGFDEVNDKIARYSAKSKEDLEDYLLVHPVPIVIGNGGGFCVTDHHHLANAPCPEPSLGGPPALWLRQEPAWLSLELRCPGSDPAVPDRCEVETQAETPVTISTSASVCRPRKNG